MTVRKEKMELEIQKSQDRKILDKSIYIIEIWQGLQI